MLAPKSSASVAHGLLLSKGAHRAIPIREFSTSPNRESSIRPIFASTLTMQEKLAADVKPLLKENGGGWVLSSNGMALEAGWEFSGFNKAWAFMDAVAVEAKSAKHHPEWANTYNRVVMRWTTHRDQETKQSGMTARDLQLAIRCSELAKDHGAKKELELDVISKEGSADLERLHRTINKLDGCSACER